MIEIGSVSRGTVSLIRSSVVAATRNCRHFAAPFAMRMLVLYEEEPLQPPTVALPAAVR